MIDFYLATDQAIRAYIWQRYHVHVRDEHIEMLRAACLIGKVWEDASHLVCECSGGFYIVPGKIVLY
jgi:hypothetical protein